MLTVSPACHTPNTLAVNYGHSQFRGTPTGKVTIKAGGSTLCTITLKAGRGSCTLTAGQLKPGTYRLTASYAGSIDFTSSISPARTLTVTK